MYFYNATEIKSFHKEGFIMKQLTSAIAIFLLLIATTTVSISSNATKAKSASIANGTTQKAIVSATTSKASSAKSPTGKTTKDCLNTVDTIIVEELEETYSPYNAEAINGYEDTDLDLLARLIYAEAGCDWIPDWVQLYVGSVVLNRVSSNIYPDTIEEVIYDPGQYVPASFECATPDERTISNARQLLEGGSVLPPDVLGQNGDATGDGIYCQYYDPYIGSTIYFTYVY